MTSFVSNHGTIPAQFNSVDETRLQRQRAIRSQKRMKNVIFHELAEAARRGESVALGIISGVKGSSPQKVGAKALFHADGRITGTVGGGCLEAEIRSEEN